MNSRYKIVYLLFFLTIISKVHAQVNYVLNPSLEQYTQCPNGPDQINYARYWSSIDSNQVHGFPTDGEPEYINACAGNNTLVGVPYSGKGHAYPHTGNGMASVAMYDTTTVSFPYQRDYLQGRLYKKLTADSQYCVTFYVFLEQVPVFAINHIGAYLDGGQIDTAASPGLPQTRYTPQILENSVILDTVHWTKIEGTFKATGTECFVTIGTFFDNAHITAINFQPNYNSDFTSMYFVDDISVVASNIPAYAGGTFFKAKKDSVFIGRNEIVPDCAWYRNGVLIDTIHAGFWVKDTVNTAYVVKQSICGNVKWDTAKIYIVPENVKNVGGNVMECVYRVFPNPAKDEITITAPNNMSTVSMAIYDLSGRGMMQQQVQFANGEVRVPLSLPGGVYVVELVGMDGGRSLVRLSVL